MTYKEFIDKLVDYVEQSGDWKVQDLIPRMVFSNKVQTMATNTHNIFINPNFAASLTMPQVVGVLWHEALHDLYDHHKVPWARYDVSSGLSPRQWHYLTNIAMDLIINDTVLASGQELPSEGIFRKDFPYITDDMTTSHKVFKAMLQHLQEQRQNASQNSQKSSSSSSSSSTSDDEGEGGQSQEEVVIEISPDDPIAEAMANQAQQEEDDEAIANEPPRSPEDLDESDDSDDTSNSSSSSGSISEEEKDEKQSQIDEARQSIDDARSQLEEEEQKLKDRLDELNQDSDKGDDDDTDDSGESDDVNETDGEEEPEDNDNRESEKEDIENKLKELEDRRKELDEKSDELDKMQEELDSLDTDDSEEDTDTYDDSDKDESSADDGDLDDGDSEGYDDFEEANDIDDSINDDTPLSELLSDLVEEISTEVLRDLTAVDKTKRMPIPALLNAQVTWIDKVFSRVGRYLAQQSRDRTFSRPARRNPYGLPDSDYKTPQKGSLIRDYKPTVCFYLDASGSMYGSYYENGKRIRVNGPEIIRKKLAQRAQLLKDTRSIVIPFSNALGRPIDVTAKFPYEYEDNFVGGTDLNNVINDINKNSFDVSVIITDATETLYVDRIDNNHDVVIVLPYESSISGDTSRRNIEIIQQEDLLK